MTFHPQTDDERAVSQAVDRLFETYVARDMDGMLGCYTPDLVVIPQGGDPIYGLEECGKCWPQRSTIWTSSRWSTGQRRYDHRRLGLGMASGVVDAQTKSHR